MYKKVCELKEIRDFRDIIHDYYNSDLVDRYNLLLQDNYDMYKKVCELKEIRDFKDTIHDYCNLKK